MLAALPALLAALTISGLLATGQTPQPFPSPGGTRPAAPAQPARGTPPPAPAPPPAGQAPAPSAPPPPAAAAPTEAMLGVPIYPGAQFITSYNAGRGQRYYLFGSTAPFLDLVTY